MESQIIAQRDMSAGQIDATSVRADDTDIMRAGLRTARNVRILATRGVADRPGRRFLFTTTGVCDIVQPTGGTEWYMAIEPGAVRFRRKDLAVQVNFESLSQLTAPRISEVRWVESGGVVILCHQAFRPLVFNYSVLTGSWTMNTFAFSQDPSGAVRQPYHNFNLGSGVTIVPSARSGSITVSASAPVFTFLHVGVVFRYAERQFVVTGYVSPGVVTANVIEELPPTFTITVDNVAGLQVGDVAEGVTSGTKGQVTFISGLDVTVLASKNWSGFEVGEKVAGPRSKMTVSAQATAAPAATIQWDEALMSDYRGWPGCVSKDVQRIIFCRFKQFNPAVVWSSTGTLNDFLVGAEKDDAIFEYVPENCTVLDVVGGADEFVFTDKGTYHIPVSTSNPLIPGSIDFKLISDDPAAFIRPRLTTEGMIFINSTRTRIFAIIGTGQTARPYVVEDVSEFHSKVIGRPVVLATSSADASAPERYLYAGTSDGTIAVGRYQRGVSTRGWIGWVPWDGLGAIKWVASSGGEVTVTAEYAGGLRFVEVFDDTCIVDATRPVSAWGIGAQISVVGGWYRGDYVKQGDGSLLSAEGAVIDAAHAAGMSGGYSFDVEVEPFVPHVDAGPSRKQRLRRRRLKQIAATFQRTQAISVDGYDIPFYRGGENEEDAPPSRDETYRARKMGRDFDPRWSVRRRLPGNLTIIELTSEVTI